MAAAATATAVTEEEEVTEDPDRVDVAAIRTGMINALVRSRVLSRDLIPCRIPVPERPADVRRSHRTVVRTASRNEMKN